MFWRASMRSSYSSRMRYEGMVIDPHVHLDLGLDNRVGEAPQTLSDYEAMTAPLNLRASGVLVMATPELDRARRLNDAALALAEQPNWFALCSAHPHAGEAALAEIDRVAAAGARGLKLHPTSQRFDPAHEGVGAIVGRAAEHGLPVLFDGFSPTDPAQSGKFMELALGHPEAQIVIAHAHFMKFSELLVYPILERYPKFARNIWLDLSATLLFFAGSPYQEQLEWVLRQVGIDRLIWASDFPLDNPAESLLALDSYTFTAEEQQTICHDNAMDLFRQLE